MRVRSENTSGSNAIVLMFRRPIEMWLETMLGCSNIGGVMWNKPTVAIHIHLYIFTPIKADVVESILRDNVEVFIIEY